MTPKEQTEENKSSPHFYSFFTYFLGENIFSTVAVRLKKFLVEHERHQFLLGRLAVVETMFDVGEELVDFDVMIENVRLEIVLYVSVDGVVCLLMAVHHLRPDALVSLASFGDALVNVRRAGQLAGDLHALATDQSVDGELALSHQFHQIVAFGRIIIADLHEQTREARIGFRGAELR